MASARIGIELEFMAAYKLPDSVSKSDMSKDNRWPDSELNTTPPTQAFYAVDSCILQVCEVLARCGIPVACKGDTDPYANAPDNAYIDGSDKSRLRVWNTDLVVAKVDGQEPRFSYWYVSQESSVNVALDENPIKGTPKGYEWYALEISSPIMYNKMVNQQLHVVRAVLASLRNNMKIWLSTACGMHVHVSPLTVQLDLDVAKRLAAIISLVEEPLILKICHPSRLSSLYARPVRRASKIAGRISNGQGITSGSARTELSSSAAGCINCLNKFRGTLSNRSAEEPLTFSVLCSMFSEESIEALRTGLEVENEAGRVLSTSRIGLNISEYGTAEFRYFEATLDPDLISFWVQFVQQILAICQQPDDEFCKTLCRLYELGSRQQNMGWVVWLQQLGLEHFRDFCAKHIDMYGRMKDFNREGILSRLAT